MHVTRTLQGSIIRLASLSLLMLVGVSTTAWAQAAVQPSTAPSVRLTLSPASLPNADKSAPTSAPAPAPAATPAPTPDPPSGVALPTTRAGWEGFGIAQPAADKGTLEVYGFGMADAIADFNQNNPDWYDIVRPTKLPSFAKQYGEDGHFYLSPRQSRFGVKGELPTTDGNVKGQFEFDMFGVGPDAGITTIRLRHAWGQWKQIGGGQTNSQFMDVDVFPNVVEYWGPPGMLFVRNPQVFYEFRNDDKWQATAAIEAPGASGDAGLVADRIELQGIRARFPLPDFTGHVRMKGKKGYIQVGGALRKINYDDTVQDQFDLSGSVTGWGFSFSSNVNATPKDVLRLQYIYGHGIQNFFNDSPVDVAAKSNPGNAVTPVVGEALPVQGLVLFIDHQWNDKYSTSAGYSRVDVDNTDLQLPSAYKSGQYVIANLLCTPVKNVLMGVEFQWGHRENHSDGFKVDDVRIQASFKYSFGMKIGG
ncbi:MAG TPA: DcaP family trimeric outer membrane transporter [Vicinamibacterales bacterium]|nr:DcaP family trimeric outer membrane transporter [Vicinamibacterales bacterium]